MKSTPDEDWLLETSNGTLTVSWPQAGDVIDEPALAHTGNPRVSFGYAAKDAAVIAKIVGTEVLLTNAFGRWVRLQVDRIDVDLKIVEGKLVEKGRGDASP